MSMKRMAALAAVLLAPLMARADTYQIDFGPPGHTEYTGTDYGEAKQITPSKPGENGDSFSVTGLEYKLGDSVTLAAEKVGAFSVDGDADPKTPDAMLKSFIFANPENPAVGAAVELKLSGVKPTDKVTFAFIRSNQNFDANVTIIQGEKQADKDITSDKEFTAVGTFTGSDSYIIKITHLTDKPAEANIAGARITIEAGE